MKQMPGVRVQAPSVMGAWWYCPAMPVPAPHSHPTPTTHTHTRMCTPTCHRNSIALSDLAALDGKQPLHHLVVVSAEAAVKEGWAWGGQREGVRWVRR